MRTGTAVRWLVVGVLLVIGGCNKSKPNSSSGSAGNSGGATASNTPAGNSSAANSPASGAPAANTTPSQPAPPPPVVIDAGTLLTVTIDQTVSSKTNNNGDPFAASLAAPISVGGLTVLPTGTRARGTVVQADSAGRVKGGAVLALTLDSLTVNGQPYSIQTSEFEETIKGRGKRTAIGAGGGAAFGAIIGGLAGGGKGAAIGALVGGGAGTAGTAFTGKRDITIPAETRLHFKLTAPLTIQPPTPAQ
ncbi:MAG: hypothetical protein WB723_21505 [Candidatus Acidiferrales bacterium]